MTSAAPASRHMRTIVAMTSGLVVVAYSGGRPVRTFGLTTTFAFLFTKRSMPPSCAMAARTFRSGESPRITARSGKAGAAVVAGVSPGVVEAVLEVAAVPSVVVVALEAVAPDVVAVATGSWSSKVLPCDSDQRSARPQPETRGARPAKASHLPVERRNVLRSISPMMRATYPRLSLSHRGVN